MLIHGDGNCVNLLKDPIVKYDEIFRFSVSMTLVDPPNNTDKVKHSISFNDTGPKLEVGDYV